MAARVPRTIHAHEDFKAVVRQEVRRLGRKANLNHLDVSSVIDMSGAFQGIDFDGDISAWDVSSVSDMGFMFARCPFNGDISKWQVGMVRNAKSMFAESSFNGDISQWDTARVIDMSRMFHKSPFNGDVSRWDVQNVQDFEAMFKASAFKGDTGAWKFANVRCINDMFYQCPWRGVPGNLRFRQGLEFTLFFDPTTAQEFGHPNFYHWFLAVNGHSNMHVDWLMLVALVPPCKDILATAQATLVLQDWWANGTGAHESYEHAFESTFLT